MKKRLISIFAAVTVGIFPSAVSVANNDSMNMYRNSDFIEKEQPDLSAETKRAISAYQKNPTEENYSALQSLVIKDYDAVVARKEAKLAELEEETAGKPGGDEIVAEMAELVDEIHETYWNRINSTMLRFTDPRLLKWKTSQAYNYDYIPVMGAGESIYVSRTPVTNAQYAEFIAASGHDAPSNWENKSYADGEDDYPVNCVSYTDAEAYCEWLTENDSANTYRLPGESEWELAAGHMPKDADFNCGVNDGRTPVLQYADVTRGAHGAVDFWGNVWEWTSEVRSIEDGVTYLGVKGGSWKSARTDCRTEYRKESRDASKGYDDVGFRVIQVLNGEEPAVKVDIATLDTPAVSAETGMPFDDVKSSDEYYSAVKYVWENGILEGVSDSEFAPDAAMTRAMLVTALARLAAADVSGCTASSFADNVSGEWYAPYIEWAAANGIVNGCGDGIFGVNNEVTIEQAAAIFARYAEKNGCMTNYTENSLELSDNVSDWARTPILWAVQNGILSADNALNPTASATRALIAEMFYGCGDLLKNAPDAPSASETSNIKACEYGGLNCLLYTPKDTYENMALVVYLHGVKGKGDNPNTLLTLDEFPKFLADGALGDVSAYVLMPQIPGDENDWLSIKTEVVNTIDEVVSTCGIDGSRVSLTGFSMGGVGVWSIASAYPEKFCRIAPCSGSPRSDARTLNALAEMPVWAFAGTEDTVVKPQAAVDFIVLLSQTNPSAQLTEFEGAGHTDVPSLAFLGTDLVKWLIEG